jgi:glycosyltransferase involved in cell wall biosynthesis
LRLLIVCDWYPSERHPDAGIFIQDQVRALARAHDVYVVVLRTLSWRRGWDNVAAVRFELHEQDGALVVNSPAMAVPLMRSLTARQHQAGIDRALKAIRGTVGTPDLIHAHGSLPSGHAALYSARRLGIPLVVTEHASDFGAYLRTDFSRRALLRTLGGADRIIAVGSVLGDQLKATQPLADVVVIGNVIDTGFFTAAALHGDGARPGGRIRFLSVGSLTPRKGHETTLEALAELVLARGLDAELVVIGEGPDRRRLSSQARSAGISDRLTLAGALSRASVRQWMARSDVFVSASRHETFGVALAEALAFGLPAVVVRTADPESLMRPGFGLVLEDRDPGALAAAMLSASAEDGRNADARRSSIESRFGTAAFLEKIGRVYEDVRGRPSGGATRELGASS